MLAIYLPLPSRTYRRANRGERQNAVTLAWALSLDIITQQEMFDLVPLRFRIVEY
jgi:hypothetical protein